MTSMALSQTFMNAGPAQAISRNNRSSNGGLLLSQILAKKTEHGPKYLRQRCPACPPTDIFITHDELLKLFQFKSVTSSLAHPVHSLPRRRVDFCRSRRCKTFGIERKGSVVLLGCEPRGSPQASFRKDPKIYILKMKRILQPIKSSSLQQPLKSPSSRSGKFGKRKPLSSDFPQSQSRNKILTDDGPRRSLRLLEKRQVSSVPVTSGTKRKILTVAPGNAKRFKDSQGKSIEDFQAGLLDLSKESSAKENETLDGVEAKLRSEYPPVIPSSAARTWDKKNGVKVFDPEVKGLGCNEEDDDDDTEEEDDDDTEEEDDDDTEEEEDDDHEEEKDGDKEEEEDDANEEEEEDDDTEAGDIEMESDIDLLDSDAQESHVDESNATEISLPNRDEEMEEEDEDKSTENVDVSPQLMTSSGQIISDVGIDKTSPDDNSILAGPSSRVRTDLTHESAGNNTLDLSSADHAPNLSYHDGNMLDSVFHDEGNEELERIMPAWNETPLTIQQGNSGQNRWNLIEDVNELYIMLAVAISMALGIGFAVFHPYF